MADSAAFLEHLSTVLAGIEAEGLMKRERIIEGPQGAWVTMRGRRMLNLCANNYLGLADDPRLIAAAQAALQSHGYGMASVRFICARPTCTARWRRGWRPSLGPTMRSCSPPVSTPMARCSSRCWAPRMRWFPTA